MGQPVSRDTSERRQAIASLLLKDGSAQVRPLAKMFSVSDQTIRKDLDFLVELGAASRSHGGAIRCLPAAAPAETTISMKRQHHSAAKESIGRVAAATVRPGDSIILDSGSTAAMIARHLPDRDDITVITSDTGILAELLLKENINVIVLGGRLRRKNGALYSEQSLHILDNIRVDKLFLGADGITAKVGVTTYLEKDAVLNRKMIECAASVLVAADSSKFSITCLHLACPVERISAIITEKIPNDIYHSEFSERGIDILI
jgi:DeoR family transcriptional regulator of aga operon